MASQFLVVFRALESGVSEVQAHDGLTRFLQGDSLKADTILASPGSRVKAVTCEHEAEIIAVRLRRIGVHCDVVGCLETADNGDDELADQPFAVAPGRQCPHCGARMEYSLQSCPECGHSQNARVKPRRAAQGSAISSRADHPPTVEPCLREDRASQTPAARPWRMAGLPRATHLVLAAVLGLGGYVHFFVDGPVIPNPDPNTAETPSGMILKAVFNREGEPTSLVEYDPEQGENPYAMQLEAMGVDIERLRELHGHPDGIPMHEVERIVEEEVGPLPTD